jgi:hypothetical protein
LQPRNSLLDATIVAAFVGGIFALGASWFGAQESAHQRVQQAEARSVDLQAQQQKAYYEARSVACKVAVDWFMDERPNPSLTKEAQQLLVEDMRDRLRACDIPAPSSATTLSEHPKGAGANGGDSGGGGADNAN